MTDDQYYKKFINFIKKESDIFDKGWVPYMIHNERPVRKTRELIFVIDEVTKNRDRLITTLKRYIDDKLEPQIEINNDWTKFKILWGNQGSLD